VLRKAVRTCCIPRCLDFSYFSPLSRVSRSRAVIGWRWSAAHFPTVAVRRVEVVEWSGVGVAIESFAGIASVFFRRRRRILPHVCASFSIVARWCICWHAAVPGPSFLFWSSGRSGCRPRITRRLRGQMLVLHKVSLSFANAAVRCRECCSECCSPVAAQFCCLCAHASPANQGEKSPVERSQPKM
jgi:hypothetical protein